MPTPDNNNSPLSTLKDFALSDIKDKADKKFGERVVTQIENLINSGYFVERNMRFAKNRASAAGKMDMNIFKDLLDMNGKPNYTKVNWKAPMIVNTIISRLVGRWMNNKLKPKAEAIDPISLRDKKEKIDDAEFYMDNKEMLAQAQDQSGVQMIPKDQFVAEDKDQLDLWASEELRLPEEILYEKGIRTVFKDNKLDSVQYRRLLTDSATVGLCGTETLSNGKIMTRVCVPENMFYSSTEFDDFHDCSIKGEIVSKTISEIRSLYPDMPEDKLFEIAQLTKDWSNNNKITWNNFYNTTYVRPYDDWNVDIANFEIRSFDIDKSLIKTAKDGSLYVDKPKKTIDFVYNGNEYIEKGTWNIYRGCYVKTGGKKILLEWGKKKNQIKPQDPQYIGEAESSYAFFMYQNVNMQNVAIPEKIEEPVEGMILARLKIQQLTARMSPAGYKYDIDGLQAMDLGNGKLSPLELQRVTNQTGNVYFRSRDAEGNRIENPITENPNAGSVPQLQQLILIYNNHYQVLKDELGEDPNLIQQASTPRVTTENVKVSMQEADNATGHMEDAAIQCLTETANKVACLLHDSVEYGAEEYRSIMSEKDVKGRVFKVIIEMLPDDQEIADFVMEVNTFTMQHPDFILYISPFKLKTLANENLRLANLYFENSQKRAIKGQMERAQHQSEMNGQIQMQSNQQAAALAKQQQDDKLAAEKEMMEFKATKDKEVSLLNGFMAAIGKGIIDPNIIMPAIQQLVPNIAIPLAMENKTIQQGAIAQARLEQMPQQVQPEEGQQQPQQQMQQM